MILIQLGGDLDVNERLTTSSLTINVSDYIILDDGGEVRSEMELLETRPLLRNGANDLTITWFSKQ